MTLGSFQWQGGFWYSRGFFLDRKQRVQIRENQSQTLDAEYIYKQALLGAMQFTKKHNMNPHIRE